MISFELKEQIRDVLNLLARLYGTPVGVYQKDESDEYVEVACSEENFFPNFCHEVWKLDNGRGRQLCEKNMCDRAGKVLESGEAKTTRCFMQLDTDAQPILIDGEIIGSMQFGAYLADDETVPERLARLEEKLQTFAVSDSDKIRLKELFLDVKSHQSEDVKNLRSKLPEEVTQLLKNHLKKYDIDRLTFHDLQIRLLAARNEALILLDKIEENTRDRSSEQLKGLTKGANRVLGAINSFATTMHNLSRGEYLPREYTFHSKDIKKIIENSLLLVESTALFMGVEIIATDILSYNLAISEQHLQEALNNLAHNAIKYSYYTKKSPDKKKRFALFQGKKIDQSYKIWIENYGIGIEKDEFEKIFEAGYQGRLTKHEKRGGAGQGLAITKRIIEGHGGKITVYSDLQDKIGDLKSRPYKTTFVIELPITFYPVTMFY